jgi:uncharacterized protein YjbI with pentapeptide repeats
MAMPVRVVNDSGMKFSWLAGRVPPRPLTGTFIVKATLEIEPGRPASLVPPDDQLDPDGEKTLDDDLAAGPIYPGDFALFKPGAEILLTGSAHSPEGRPVAWMPVTLHLGQWSKSLSIFGDRLWTRDGLSEPRPFTSMPLTWERAFGGPSFKRNPCGRGAEAIAIAGAGDVLPAPNVEHPEQLVTSPSSRPDPASFAPLGSSWSQRMKNLGTYDGQWLRERWPWLPDDFDWSYFNAAPQDQRFKGFLRGDETIVLEGMNAAHPRIETALPALKPRWFMRQQVQKRLVFGEIPLKLDTVFIDTEKMRIVLLWRGVVSIYSLKMKEVTDHLLVSEPLDEPDKGLPYFEAMLERRKGEIDNPNEEVEPEGTNSPFPLPDVPPMDMSWVRALDEEMAADVRNAEAAMAQMRSDPSDPSRDFSEYLGPVAMDAPASQTYADVEEGVESVLGRLRDSGPEGAAFADQEWLPATLKADMEAMDRVGQQLFAADEPGDQETQPWTRERVEQHHRARGSFEDQELDGLDLAELDLRGAMLRGASMAGCDVSGAKLDGAMLDGAVLEGAMLTEATLAGASLRSADLTNARAALASFSDATLDDAVFVGAKLQGADFRQARGTSCDFAAADLTMADLRGAAFERADFSHATLEKLKASGASLVSCDVGQTKAGDVDLTGANVHDLRATAADLNHAVLRGVTGEKTAWDDANLSGADFTEAQLPGAVFDGANLEGAVLDRANLATARLCDVNLTGASAYDANLFRATLENARLEGAVFVGANMYEVEFYQATYEGAHFTDANLKGTKLA